MACSVTITTALGFVNTNNQLVRAEVYGTIDDCADCGTLFVTIGNAAAVEATLTSASEWKAVFDGTPAGVVCKTDVSVRAFFQDGACEGAEDRVFFDCEPDEPAPDCPTVTITVTPTEVCTDEGRIVELDVAFGGAEPPLWSWTFGDGQNSEIIFSGGETQIEHAYPADEASTYTGYLTVGLAGCDQEEFTVMVDACPPTPPPDCPERSVRIRVLRDANGDDKTPSVENGLCLDEGGYSLTPDISGDTYAWYVDGNQVSTDASLGVPLACDEEVEVIVIVTTDGCSYAGDVTLIGCPCDSDGDDGGGDDGGGDDDEDGDGGDDEIVPPDPPDPPDPPVINWCWVWFWGNVGLFVVTALFILITFCMIGANVWAAIAALGSGGTLSAVWAALTAANIVMLIISAVLAVLSLVSFILWILVCALNRMRDIICSVLALLMSILAALMALSIVVAIVLWLIGQFGCAVGGFIDVAWFGLLMSITWYLGLFLGCWGGGGLMAARRRAR